MPRIEKEDVLLVVDVQRDFCPGGALAVREGDAVVSILNRLIPRFDLVIFTRDWHPHGHMSFSEKPQFRDMSWPVHCVRDTPGAAFHPDLIIPPGSMIVSKGTERSKEAYSAFSGTDLAKKLAGRRRIYIGGLTTDYCVKETTLDALQAGFEMRVIRDAIRGVDVPPGSAEDAIDAMVERGAVLVESKDLVS